MIQYLITCLLVGSFAICTAAQSTIHFSFHYYQKNDPSEKVGWADTKIKITNNRTQEVFESVTDKHGVATFELVAGDNYVATIPSHQRTIPLRLSHLPAGAFSRFSYERVASSRQYEAQKTIPTSVTSSTINFDFYYHDREQTADVGVEGVSIIVVNTKTAKRFQSKTDKKGRAAFKLPIHQKYQVEIPIEEATFDLNVTHLSTNGSSKMTYKGYTPTYYRAMAIEDSLSTIEFMKLERIVDSMEAANAKKPGHVFFHFVQDLGSEHQFWGGKVFDASTADTSKSLGEDNRYTTNGTCMKVLSKRGKLTKIQKPGTYPFYAIGLIDDKVYEWQGSYTLNANEGKVIYLRATTGKQVDLTQEEYNKL